MADAAFLHLASRCTRLALAGIGREYPNKLDHVMGGVDDVRGPRDLHPAFYGCYDWHSAVHAHWLLARVLRRCGGAASPIPELPQAVAVLDEHLTPANIAVEVDYLRRPLSRAFERTYGWAWALKLHEELGRDARNGGLAAKTSTPGTADRFQLWERAVRPLADAIVQRYEAYLPNLTYPIRTGVHPNTAFGLLFAWDWSDWEGRTTFRELVEVTARRLYEHDASCPAHYEPSGSDFFSPSLMEATLMSRVLRGEDNFSAWLRRFLPHADRAQPTSLFEPAIVSDRTDPQIVHLDGLNLSRAWCMRMIEARLVASPPTDPGLRAWAAAARDRLRASADRHQLASLPHVASGAYEGDHWLGTFAMLAVDRSG